MPDQFSKTVHEGFLSILCPDGSCIKVTDEHADLDEVVDLLNAMAAEIQSLQAESIVLRHHGDGPMMTGGKHWAVKALVSSLADTLGDTPNFVVGEVGPFCVTVQRRHGKSPARIIGELTDAALKLCDIIDYDQEGRGDAIETIRKLAAKDVT